MARPQPARYRRKSSPSKAYPRPKASLLSLSSRKTLQYVTLATAAILTLLFFLSPRSPAVQDLKIFHHTPTHKPPAQKNSTSGEVRWYSDWKWHKPFSASITLDEDRSVLPPLKTRPPIYTYYDTEEKKDEKVKAAENRLLLLWRRAWWAQGFRPVVLGKSEATNHPSYSALQTKSVPPQMKTELMRWLAWGQMGTGILANWLVHPMGARDETLLSTLRRGEYSHLTRYEGLGGGLFSGEQTSINNAIKEALESSKLKEAKSILDALSHQTLSVESTPIEIAFYDSTTNSEHYKAVTATLGEDKAKGLESLAALINSHLHLTFLNTFPDGFAVLSPFSKQAGILSQRARSLAEALRTCPESPMPSSCPPNHPNCRPCSSSSPMKITTPETYANSTSIFTIGTIPHPLTLASLKRKTKDITTRYIRRDTSRDPWLELVTRKTLGKELGGQGRIVSFKEMVAADWAVARSLWMTEGDGTTDGENEEEATPHRKSVQYHFGFSVPPFNTTTVHLDIGSSSSSASPLTDDVSGSNSPSTVKAKKELLRSLKNQQDLVDHMEAVLQQKTGKRKNSKTNTGVREMVEAWNLADTEAWRFVRAFAARERVERKKWEEEERKFAGGEEGESGAWRWFDKA